MITLAYQEIVDRMFFSLRNQELVGRVRTKQESEKGNKEEGGILKRENSNIIYIHTYI